MISEIVYASLYEKPHLALEDELDSRGISYLHVSLAGSRRALLAGHLVYGDLDNC